MTHETSVKGMWVLDPTTEPEPMQAEVASRLDTLDNKVLGILDNAKPKADKVLEKVSDMLVNRYNLAGVVKRQKPSASKAAPSEMLDEIAEQCDFAITGGGD